MDLMSSLLLVITLSVRPLWLLTLFCYASKANVLEFAELDFVEINKLLKAVRIYNVGYWPLELDIDIKLSIQDNQLPYCYKCQGPSLA